MVFVWCMLLGLDISLKWCDFFLRVWIVWHVVCELSTFDDDRARLSYYACPLGL